MKRIDLDDLPPNVAVLLAGVEEGEEVLLVRGGAVAGRLTGGAREPAVEAGTAPPSEEQAKDILEQFRASIEDEF